MPAPLEAVSGDLLVDLIPSRLDTILAANRALGRSMMRTLALTVHLALMGACHQPAPLPIGASGSTPAPPPETAAPATAVAPSPADPTPGSAAEACAERAMAAIKARDPEALADLAHPQRGIRFTPYAFVKPGKDVVLRPLELRRAFSDPSVRDWGALGESDDRIRLTFARYFDRYVYDVDFARRAPSPAGTPDAAEGAAFNVTVLLADLRAAYPHGRVFEHHHPPDPRDNRGWRVLRLVCEEHEGKHYLAGVVHSEWTP